MKKTPEYRIAKVTPLKTIWKGRKILTGETFIDKECFKGKYRSETAIVDFDVKPKSKSKIEDEVKDEIEIEIDSNLASIFS